MLELPDVLVCGAGGTLGEAWMRGLLDGAGAEAGLDFRRCEHIVGTSAGSIVGAVLAAGHRPDAGREAARAWTDAAAGAPAGETDGHGPAAAGAPAGETDGHGPGGAARARRGAVRVLARAGAAAVAPTVPLALAATAPGGAALRAAALRAVPRRGRPLARVGALVDRLGPRFDGRLRIAAVDRARGRRVIFGAPGSPPAAVSEAVLASCAVPGLFPPVRIAGREYVDGGVWSPTNLDAAPAGRGEQVLCLVPTAVGPLRAATSALLATETLALRARGARVRTVRPDAASAAAMGSNLMDRRRTAAVLAAGYAQGRREAQR